MFITIIKNRTCPNCQAKSIKPLDFRLLQPYCCENCHKQIKTPDWFKILTVFVLIVLYFLCIEFDKNENGALGLLIFYLLFETKINAIVAPLIVVKNQK